MVGPCTKVRMRTRVPALVLALSPRRSPGAPATPGTTRTSRPDRSPEDAATALASGLAAKDLSKVAFTPDTATAAQASYDQIVEQLGDAGLTVDVGDVERTGSTAEATLHWTWDLTAASWEYDAPAELKFAEDAWQVAWAPSIVEASLVDGRGARRLLGARRPRRHPRCRWPADRHRARRSRGWASTSRPSTAPTRPPRRRRWPRWSASTRRRTSRRCRRPARRRSSRRSSTAARSCRPP